ncbi:hypothetical protein, partial [Citrobacter freundii]|uniref:hypothetical protein n=2 Tax=Pseudomonadota TaxID=1224 RepID=UPI001954FA25
EWQAVKDNQMCQLSIERSDPDRVITSLVSTIYGLALALRRKDEIIQVQAKQLEIGSGKIAAFPPRRL